MVIDVDKELEDLQGQAWTNLPDGIELDFHTWADRPRTCEWMITQGYCCTDFPDESVEFCECWDNDRIRQVILLRRARFNYGYRKR